MNRFSAIDMFNIIEGRLLPEQFDLNSSEYANIKQKIIDNDIQSFSDRQTAYNVVQTTRYYFNKYVDKPDQNEGFKADARRFDLI